MVWEGKEKKRNEYVMVSKVEAGSRAARMGARTVSCLLYCEQFQ